MRAETRDSRQKRRENGGGVEEVRNTDGQAKRR